MSFFSFRGAPVRVLAVLLCAALPGCAVLRAPTVPMETRLARSTCTDEVRTLVVFLPGAWSAADEFAREGFVRELAERGIAADALLVDAHMAYYRNRTVVERLDEDVIQPARAAGYRQLWLVGISVGGFGALLHEQQKPGATAGLVVLAPYLGPDTLLDEVRRAGGLAGWNPPPLAATDAAEHQMWRWLQAYTAAAPGTRPPLYLGYGRQDRFAPGNALLGAALAPAQVMTTDGGHDWPAWRRLWRQALEVLPLPACRTQAARASSDQRGRTSKE